MQTLKVIGAAEAASRINNIDNNVIKNGLLKDLEEGNFKRVQQELGVCVVPDSCFNNLKKELEAHSRKQTLKIGILVSVLGSLAMLMVPVIWIPCVLALWFTSMIALKRLC